MMSVERCRKLYDEGRLPECIFFFRPSKTKDQKGVFSQWFISDFSDGTRIYTSAEQYMMSQKAFIMGDKKTFDMIMAEKNPAELKKYGRLVKNFNDDIWNAEKYGIVLRASIFKFSTPELRDCLLSTKGKILVEASPYDPIWGIKMGENENGINNPHNWKGENLLGRALMEARSILLSI